jgi:FMN phosphatase YigB (HAD superfamily)
MPLSLEQYAEYLDSRSDLAWPAPAEPKPPKAKAHLVSMPEIRAVTWSIYGTLVRISGGELYLEHPEPMMMQVALDKVVQEFKLWKAMTRKPGQPAEQLRQMYLNALHQVRFQLGSERHAEFPVEKIWESIIKKLLQNEYGFDAGFFGSLDEYSRKIAYFFHASLQGTACFPEAATALVHVRETLGVQGLLADAQCFTPIQLARGLKAQGAELKEVVPPDYWVLSYEERVRKPSEKLYKEMLGRLKARGLEAREVLHIGTDLVNDLGPARRCGLRTGLFAGDKQALQFTPEQLKQPNLRPDVLLTDLSQIRDVVGP